MPDKILILNHLNNLLPKEYRISLTPAINTKEWYYQKEVELKTALTLYRLEYVKQNGEDIKYSIPTKKYLPDISNSFMTWTKEFQKIIDEEKEWESVLNVLDNVSNLPPGESVQIVMRKMINGKENTQRLSLTKYH